MIYPLSYADVTDKAIDTRDIDPKVLGQFLLDKLASNDPMVAFKLTGIRFPHVILLQHLPYSCDSDDFLLQMCGEEPEVLL